MDIEMVLYYNWIYSGILRLRRDYLYNILINSNLQLEYSTIGKYNDINYGDVIVKRYI